MTQGSSKRNDPEFDAIAEVLLDDLKYIETFLVVKTKDSRTVPFKFTPIQRKVADEQVRRNIYLKPRQVGMSTFHLARRFARVCTRPNWTAVSIAHDADTTELLFQTVQFFYNNLPPEFRPKTKYNNRKELYFPELNSRYIIFTAGNKNGVGRGTTVNDLHGSEVSRWSTPGDIISGLMEAAPKNAYVDLESTANGAGGYFHSEYADAKAGRNTYKAFFFPWWWEPEYRLTDLEAIGYNVDPFAALDEEETELAAKHGLDRQQINWRRWKQVALKEKFPQEYPEDEDTCFLTSGDLYLGRAILLRARGAGVREPVETREDGALKVWQPPEENHYYLIGADVAEGLTNGDYDAASVLDYETGDEVAVLHGKWDTHEFAGLLAALAIEYNYAQIAVEKNNHGHAVLSTLMYEIGYSNLYEHEDYDAQGKKRKVPGWPTTSKTKPIMLSTLKQALKDAPDTFHDSEFFSECFTFVRNEGKIGAIPGCYDDLVMARAIVQEVWKQHRPVSDHRAGSLIILPANGF
jgi:hypothetical protein